METALITGAASGIGAALAERLAADGVRRLVLWDRNDEGLRATAARCSGATCHTVVVDLSNEHAVAGEFAILEREGRLPDFIFHAAGVLHTGALDELNVADCRLDMETNYFGTVNLLVNAGRRLARGSRIICTSSVAGLKGLPEFPGYCASKFAVLGFCEGVYSDLKKKAIDLSVLCPPAVDTPMVQNLPKKPTLYSIFPFAPKEQVVDAVVRAIDERDDFLILVDRQTRLLRLANGLAPRTVSRVFDKIIDWKRSHRR